jgi:peptide-methionine (R)-S-oxide reductase
MSTNTKTNTKTNTNPTKRKLLLIGGITAMGFTLNSLFGIGSKDAEAGETAKAAETFPVVKTDAEWKTQLGPQAYDVLRHEGTERPFSSPLNKEHRTGVFACAGCGNDAFSSKTKFESGTGWPSFYQPLEHAITEHRDSTFGMVRTEVHCVNCGGHFGHVFNDGPKPTGLRYCMNGLSLNFKPDQT